MFEFNLYTGLLLVVLVELVLTARWAPQYWKFCPTISTFDYPLVAVSSVFQDDRWPDELQTGNNLTFLLRTISAGHALVRQPYWGNGSNRGTHFFIAEILRSPFEPSIILRVKIRWSILALVFWLIIEIQFPGMLIFISVPFLLFALLNYRQYRQISDAIRSQANAS